MAFFAKRFEDNSRDIEILQALLDRDGLSDATRSKIAWQIKAIRAGDAAEKQVAYELQASFAHTDRWAIFHNLRLEHAGLSAQIDFLLVNQGLHFVVVESKSFSEGFAINANGEFTRFFAGKPAGMPSPISQNEKHINLLRMMMEAEALPRPKGILFGKADYFVHGAVVVSPTARVSRAPGLGKKFDCVIKSDQIKDYVYAQSGQKMLMRVKDDEFPFFTAKILEAHRPIQRDWARQFGLSAEQSAKVVPAPRMRFRQETNPEAVSPGPAATDPAKAAETAEPAAVAQVQEGEKKKLICAKCEAAVPFAVARFCWMNKRRFGGDIYCRECQSDAKVEAVA